MTSKIFSLDALPTATLRPNISAPRSAERMYRQLVGQFVDDISRDQFQYATNMLVQDALFLEALELDSLEHPVSIGTILSTGVWSTQTSSGDAVLCVGLLFLQSVQQFCWIGTRSNMRDSIDEVDIDQMRRTFRRRLPMDVEELEAGGTLDADAWHIYSATSQAARWFMIAHEFAHIRSGDVSLSADSFDVEHRYRELAADRSAIEVTEAAVRRLHPSFDAALVTALGAVYVLESLRLLNDAHPTMRALEEGNASTFVTHGPSQDRRGYVVGLYYPGATRPHAEIRRAMMLSHHVFATHPIPDPRVEADFAQRAVSFTAEDAALADNWWRTNSDGTTRLALGSVFEFAQADASRCEVFLSLYALLSNWHHGKEQYRSMLAFLFMGYCAAEGARSEKFASLLRSVVYDFDELVALRMKDMDTPGVRQPHEDDPS